MDLDHFSHLSGACCVHPTLLRERYQLLPFAMSNTAVALAVWLYYYYYYYYYYYATSVYNVN